MVKKKIQKNNVVIFQAKSGAIELKGDFSRETIWGDLNQIAQLFETDKSGISRHIDNIFKSGELDQKRTVAKIATVQTEGKRTVKREIEYFNLDVILSVGYRVNSKQATIFRQWATKTLRSYIVDGYAINKKRIGQNYERFLNVVQDIQKLLPVGTTVQSKDAIELISQFADTWLSLDAYDREASTAGKLTKKKVDLTAEKMQGGFANLKSKLIAQSEATDIFGNERHAGAIAGIVGNVMQSFGGKDVYPSVEEKAAHLLYFLVKNHPFTDGNKRSGAFAFIWFLQQADQLDMTVINSSALTALTVMVEESDAQHKDKVIKLILNMISKK